MLYIYRHAASESANLLAEDIMLKGTRARRTKGELLRTALQAGDAVVCWGTPLPAQLAVPVTSIKVLNNKPVISKFTEAQTLAAAGVPTVQVSRTRPAPVARAPFTAATTSLAAQTGISIINAEAIARQLLAFVEREQERRRQYDAQPAVPSSEWLPRRNDHVGGRDLLTPPTNPDYYSKKENIVSEYRIHMFRGKSIRAGQKTQRPTRPNGQPSHPWIRSFNAGWIIAYNDFQSTSAMRELAKSALVALGLDFGAVDIGQTADGRLIVLEVNRAPGVEGGTSESYANHIIAWANERG